MIWYNTALFFIPEVWVKIGINTGYQFI